MLWYLKALLADRRFRNTAAVAIGLTIPTVAAFIFGRSWALRFAQFVLLPALVLTVLAMFVLFGLIIRNDYRERSGFKGWK